LIKKKKKLLIDLLFIFYTTNKQSFSGETAQRWLPPGEIKGASDIHNFFSCCGGSIDLEACCANRLVTFDEPINVDQRRPGMGRNVTDKK
jgi:hypothetical protein